ncbi:MAG TPA: AAA family ATPase [Caldisericia bacterium]|nr:AAA family ATPase [Caldisericia bacterium]HPF49391.1 AAA family ATPase [Caldisericia bacterium]HPI84406.1 AAA family ATPase [Caldisericia bacterium]HPQ93562.1 AAA family ATPase [Caldisericia bacterium]HRV75531.1 AAA family ATPase [Caldisericia bacterium]
MIKKISKIKNIATFKDFNWDTKLPDMKKYNLFFGWNGTGKTTISEIFRSLEKGTNEYRSDSEFILQLNEFESICQSNIGDTSFKIPIRVFNRYYVEQTLSKDSKSYIYYFTEDGEVNTITEIEDKIDECKTKKATIDTEHARKTKEFDKYVIAQAKQIKDRFIELGIKKYSTFDKAMLHRKFKEMSVQKRGLTTIEYSSTKLKEIINFENGLIIERYYYTPCQLSLFIEKANMLLTRATIEDGIKELASKPSLSNWIEEGASIHGIFTNNKKTNCLFCGNVISEGRIELLTKHFNEKYREQITDLHKIKEKFTMEINELMNYSRFVDSVSSANIYPDVRDRFIQTKDKFKAEYNLYYDYLNNSAKKISDKISNIFLINLGQIEYCKNNIAAIVSNLSNLLDEHNNKVARLNNEKKNAIENLMAYYIHLLSDGYLNKSEYIDVLADKSKSTKLQIDKLESERTVLREKLIDYHRPARELNYEIKLCLGYDDFSFEDNTDMTGYLIRRKDGTLANKLSEGERTAITLIYFLKSLSDRNLNIHDCIVVIDDPISSLDSNLLHHAYSTIIDRCKNVGQLLILTHNFRFFKYVNRWLCSKNKERTNKNHSVYMLNNYYSNSTRHSKISRIDKLLQSYESDYEYLFSKMLDFNKIENPSLEECYHMPNILRKILESFLSYKIPVTSNDTTALLDKLLEASGDNNPSRARKIYQFVNCKSHLDTFDQESSFNTFTLSETKDITHDVAELLRELDPDVYARLERKIKNSRSQTQIPGGVETQHPPHHLEL